MLQALSVWTCFFFFILVKALHGRSVGRAWVSKKKKKSIQHTHHILAYRSLRWWSKRVPLFFLSLARRVDGWMVSKSLLPSPGQSACLSRRRDSNRSSHRWPGWKGRGAVTREISVACGFGWLVHWAGIAGFFLLPAGWMDLGGGGGGREDIRVLLCLLCAGRLGVEWTGERVMVVVVVV